MEKDDITDWISKKAERHVEQLDFDHPGFPCSNTPTTDEERDEFAYEHSRRANAAIRALQCTHRSKSAENHGRELWYIMKALQQLDVAEQLLDELEKLWLKDDYDAIMDLLE